MSAKPHNTHHLEVLGGIMTLMAASVVAFTRRDLGARLMPTLFRTCILAAIVFILYRFASPPLPSPWLFPFFLGCLILLFIHHQLSVWFRRRPDIHSYSTGRTRLRLPVRINLVHRYVEPLACIGIGAILVGFDPLLGAWFFGASVSLFVEEQIARVQGRKRLMDTLDGRTETGTLQTVLQDCLEPQRPTSAQAPVAIAVKRRNGRTPKAADLAARLDPALRRIIESEKRKDLEETL